MQAFSISRNWKALSSETRTGAIEERDDIAVIHVLRILALLCVVAGHRGEAIMSGPIINSNDIEKMYDNVFDVILMNATWIVDIFFVISGCVLSWTTLGHLQRGGRPFLVAAYLYRYLRLVPAYAVTVAFLALGLPALGRGPLWLATVGEEAERCRQSWWTNMLFVNNLVRPDKPCLDPSWYMAVDTQLFAATLPLVHLMFYRPRLARRVLAVAFLASLLYPALVTWRLHLDGTLIPTPDTLGRMASTVAYSNTYVSTPCRAASYLLGLSSGWYLRHLRATGQAAPRVLRLLVAPLFLVSAAVLAAGVLFYPPLDALTPRWCHLLYAALYRPLSSLCVALLIPVVSARAGHQAAPEANKSLRPWSRLSYCIFLTHPLIQLYSIGEQRTPGLYGTGPAIMQAVIDILLACIAAMILHLTVEAPCNALLHSLKARRPRVSSDPSMPGALRAKKTASPVDPQQLTGWSRMAESAWWPPRGASLFRGR